MNYTNEQLKRTLAKMLPEKIKYEKYFDSPVEEGYDQEPFGCLCWLINPNSGCKVLETELLHLCWLVEETLNDSQQMLFISYFRCYWEQTHATWQQRTIALAQTLGIEIV